MQKGASAKWEHIQGGARIISAPTVDQTSPGHATSSLKCQGVTALSLCCINDIQSTQNFSRDQCKGLSCRDICAISSQHSAHGSSTQGVLGRGSSTALPNLPLHICCQEMGEKVPSRAMKTESREICLTFTSFEQPETAAGFSSSKSTRTTT